MEAAEAFIKGAAAAILLAFTGLLLASRRRAHAYLAAFLALVAANQAVEAFAVAFLEPHSLGQVRAYRIATVFAALDPLLLYYFVAIFPQRGRLDRTVPLVLVATTSAVLALSAAFVFPIGPARNAAGSAFSDAHSVALTLYTAAVYGIAFAHTWRALRETPGSAARLLAAAMAFAFIPVAERAARESVQTLAALLTGQVFLAGILASISVVVALCVPLAREGWRHPAGARGFVASVATVALVALLPILPGVLLYGVGAEVPSLLTLLGRAQAPVRWLLFAAFASVAILRDDVLGMGVRSRRRAARVFVGAGVLLASFAVVASVNAALGREPFQVEPASAIALVVALFASQSFRGLLDAAGSRLYAIPPPADRAAALETYRAAVDRVLRDGEDPAESETLARLREELALDAREASVLERMATEATWSVPLSAGRVVAGRYRVERLLGRGGAGRAFLARDLLLERDVVLKQVDAEGSEAALREARIAGSLQHPHVVTVLDVLARPGGTVLVTEHVAGGSLAHRIAARGALPFEEARRVVADVLAGLAAVHAKGIVHRDVKPENVLIAEDGAAKIADFGVARVRAGRTARVGELGMVEGTPLTMAPEQRRGELVGPAADVYAVGLLARAVAARLPPAHEAVVARALREAPGARWPSAEEMRRAWLAASTSGT